MEPEHMTPANKEKCLALAASIEEVQKLPGGSEFITDLLIGLLARAGLQIEDKDQISRMEKALMPFAMLGERLAGNNHDAAPIEQCFFHSPGIGSLNAGQLKAAVKALQPQK